MARPYDHLCEKGLGEAIGEVEVLPTAARLMCMGVCTPLRDFLNTTIIFFVLLMLRERLLSCHHCDTPLIFSVGCLISICDKVQNDCFNRKLENSIRAVFGKAVMREGHIPMGHM